MLPSTLSLFLRNLSSRRNIPELGPHDWLQPVPFHMIIHQTRMWHTLMPTVPSKICQSPVARASPRRRIRRSEAHTVAAPSTLAHPNLASSLKIKHEPSNLSPTALYQFITTCCLDQCYSFCVQSLFSGGEGRGRFLCWSYLLEKLIANI